MAITELNSRLDSSVHTVHALSTKLVYVGALFALSLVAFVAQTELTSQAYYLGFQEPTILLLVTHGLWWLLWPLQALAVLAGRTVGKWRLVRGKVRRQHDSTTGLLNLGAFSPWRYFCKCVVKQLHNVYHTLILVYEANANGSVETSNLHVLVDQNPHIALESVRECVRTLVRTPAFRYVAWHVALLSGVLNMAGFTWYGAMSMTYALDVTAIYNCSAFTAYAFAIPMLNERFLWLKALSVLIAVFGVFVVAYSGADEKGVYPHRFWGNVLISVGAVLYGYYEVLYKKYSCVPAHLAKVVTPRRQLTFANFVMGLLGVFTLVLLVCTVLFLQLTGLHSFNLFDYGTQTGTIWGFIGGSIVSNLLFSGGFLSLMALTSPVLSSVLSLVTIFLIGVVEWWLFGNKLGWMQLAGDALVIVGFVILTAASWREIAEGNEEDEIERASFYSFAVSEHPDAERT